MLAQGTIFRCQSCQTEVEIINSNGNGGPLVCCETEMVETDDFETLWEKEAYDEADFDWN